MTSPIHCGMCSSKVSVRPILPKSGHTTSISSEWPESQTLPMIDSSLGVSPTSIHGAAQKNFDYTLKIVIPLNTAP